MPSTTIEDVRTIGVNVADLFEPRPAVYWTDFLVAYGIAVSASIVYFAAPNFSWWQLLAWPVAGRDVGQPLRHAPAPAAEKQHEHGKGHRRPAQPK